ncbi:MAG: hypothetical protein JW741_15045 [Sedimentisphaerales bacterium]|nr:hypothetical protein [Sedimentisphaerales bacterium]
MRSTRNQTGSVLLMVVFILALLAATVMGHLQINTEEIQVMQNHLFAAEALATAEAGLNDALAQLRAEATWTGGYVDKPFNGGSYTVVVTGSTVSATGVTPRGFVAKVEADVTVSTDGPPHVVRIDVLRINE